MQREELECPLLTELGERLLSQIDIHARVKQQCLVTV